MQWDLNTDELKTAFSSKDVDLIRHCFLQAAERSSEFLKVDDVRVRFFVKKSFGEHWGVGAYAPDAHSIEMFTHPEIFRLHEDEGRERFSAIVAHELHHVMRWRGPGYGETHGEKLVSEGLALKFQRETGHPDFPDERHMNIDALREMAERAKPLLVYSLAEFPPEQYRNDIDHYQLGLPVIEAWSRYSGITAAAACHIPAEAVLGPWKSGCFDLGAEAALRPPRAPVTYGTLGARPPR